MKPSKMLLLGICSFASVTMAQNCAFAADSTHKLSHQYDGIKTEVAVSYHDSVALKSDASHFWKELNSASFALDTQNKSQALFHVNEAEKWLDRLAQTSEHHAMRVPVRGGRLTYQKDGENFEYFFPFNEDGKLKIDETMLLSLRNQADVQKMDIGLYELAINPTFVKDDLKSLKETLRHENAVEAQIKLDSLKQSLFVPQTLGDGTQPRADAIDWIDLGLELLRENHFDKLHFVFEKLRNDIVRMEQNETALSPKEPIHNLRQRLDNLVLKTPDQLRHESTPLDVEMKQWRVTLQTEPEN